MALDAVTGVTVWKHVLYQPVHSNPTIANSILYAATYSSFYGQLLIGFRFNKTKESSTVKKSNTIEIYAKYTEQSTPL